MNEPYLLGDSDPELRRLAEQHLTWSEVTHASWRRAPVRRGDRVLDVGCGPGFTTLELADWVGPDGLVLGLDPSNRFLDHLRATAQDRGLGQLEVLNGTIDAVPEDARFDVIHVRWVLCFLGDTREVITRLAERLRPGGRLITLDYFNYSAFSLAPRVPEMAEIVAAVRHSWDLTGGSLDVQGKTAALCEEAGLRVRDVRQVSGVARPGDARWRWPEAFLEGYLPRLVAQGLLESDTVEKFWQGWRSRAETGGSYLCLPPLLEITAERPGNR